MRYMIISNTYDYQVQILIIQIFDSNLFYLQIKSCNQFYENHDNNRLFSYSLEASIKSSNISKNEKKKIDYESKWSIHEKWWWFLNKSLKLDFLSYLKSLINIYQL